MPPESGEVIGVTNSVLERAIHMASIPVATIDHSRPTTTTSEKLGLMMTEDIGQTNDAVRAMISPSMLQIKEYDMSLATTLTAKLPRGEVYLITFISDGSSKAQLTQFELGQLLQTNGYENTKAMRGRTRLGAESYVDLGTLGLGEGWASPFSNGVVPHFFILRPFYGEHSDDGSGQVLTVANFALDPMRSLLVRGGDVPRLISVYYELLGIPEGTALLHSPDPKQFVFPGKPLRVSLE